MVVSPHVAAPETVLPAIRWLSRPERGHPITAFIADRIVLFPAPFSPQIARATPHRLSVK